MNQSQLKASVIDIFCGVGGLTRGLLDSGLNVVAGYDLDHTCKYGYETNNGSFFHDADVRDIDGAEMASKYWSNEQAYKVLVGCAPCQPFSSFSFKNKEVSKSEKWDLLNEFLRIIDESNPDVVSMENVPNLRHQNIFTEFESRLKEKYNVSSSVVYCPDYGVPQRRKRLVLLASKLGPIKMIKPTHDKQNYVTVEKAIKGIKSKGDPLYRFTKLSEINQERIKHSKQGGSWIDWPENLVLDCHKKSSGNSYKSVYGRMSWNDVSPTITTQFYNYGTGRFGHPKENRALTIREGAVLQTFPVDYKFFREEGSVSLKVLGRYIGNAVPPKLGEAIGHSIRENIDLYGE